MSAEGTPAPSPEVLVAGHYRCGPDYRTLRPDGARSWLITYTVEGHGLYRHGGQRLLTGPGDVVVVRPGIPHDYSVPEGRFWDFVWAHYQPRASWLSLRAPAYAEGLARVRVARRRSRDRVRAAFERLQTDAGQLGELDHELALNDLEEVLLVAANEHGDGGGRPLDPRVQRVLDVITGDLKVGHDVADLAREVSLSPSRLSHVFKQEVGDSVNATMTRLRLRQAARLLEHTSDSIGAIGAEVGFGSPYYFSRRFAEAFGMSPRGYRAATVSRRDD